MKAPRGLLRGAKINQKHSTLIDAAIPIIEEAKRLPEVSKVVLATIRDVGPGPRRLKCQAIPKGLRVTVRGADGVQTLFVYTTQPSVVTDRLVRCFLTQAA